jgi:hypothetical protein
MPIQPIGVFDRCLHHQAALADSPPERISVEPVL